MTRSTSDYQQQLLALSPGGAALPGDPDSGWGRLLGALAEEMARLDARADDLLDEADPRTAHELLADWERVYGLPDACTQESATLQQRRAALIVKIIGLGGQSRAYYQELAAQFGYLITIEEFRPFRVGQNACGEALTNGDWVHTWRVRAPETTVTPFRVGLSAAGEPLRTWGNDVLECIIRRASPAHTVVIIAYGG